MYELWTEWSGIILFYNLLKIFFFHLHWCSQFGMVEETKVPARQKCWTSASELTNLLTIGSAQAGFKLRLLEGLGFGNCLLQTTWSLRPQFIKRYDMFWKITKLSNEATTKKIFLNLLFTWIKDMYSRFHLAHWIIAYLGR